MMSSKPRPRRLLSSTGYHLLALLLSLLMLLPLLWMLAASLRPTGTPLPRTLDILPWPPAWQNYARIFELVPLGRYLLNSIWVTALAVPLSLLTASWAGFAMSQLKRRARRRLLVLSILLQMIPITALWLTRFLLFAWMGVSNSYLPLIAPALMGSSPLFILLFYWNFRRIDRAVFGRPVHFVDDDPAGDAAAPRPRMLRFERLEDRLLLSVSAEEQQFVYVLNLARHDPAAYQFADQVFIKWY